MYNENCQSQCLTWFSWWLVVGVKNFLQKHVLRCDVSVTALMIRDVWLLKHSFREMDLLTAADLAQSAQLLMYICSFVVASVDVSIHSYRPTSSPNRYQHIQYITAKCMFVYIHVLPQTVALSQQRSSNLFLNTFLQK